MRIRVRTWVRFRVRARLGPTVSRPHLLRNRILLHQRPSRVDWWNMLTLTLSMAVTLTCFAIVYSSIRGSRVWWNMSGSSVESETFRPTWVRVRVRVRVRGAGER